MNYSLKKHVRNEYYIYVLCVFSVVLFIMFALIVISGMIDIYKKINIINMEVFINIAKTFIFMPVISIVFLLIFIYRVYNIKSFLKNCMEVNAQIEKYLGYYGKYNITRQDGTETGIRVYFNYTIDNVAYKKGYSLIKNKHNINYFNKYKKQGETVKILAANNNPKKILIKEIFE